MQNVSQLVLTASRRKYVRKDDGLESLSVEKTALTTELGMPTFERSHVETSMVVIRQMSLLERRSFEPKWPDALAVEDMTAVLFERLKVVRDVNKRHIQRRAFIDLLKYMKEQGLTHNFQSNLHPMLMETRIVTLKDVQRGDDYKKYYLKSHELLLMLENSSEAENAGSQHLRNVDILRVRGFS